MDAQKIKEIYNKMSSQIHKKFGIEKPKLYVVNAKELDMKGNRFIRGQYWTRSNKLLVNKNQSIKEIKRTIRHELSHAVTKSNIHNPKFKGVYIKIN